MTGYMQTQKLFITDNNLCQASLKCYSMLLLSPHPTTQINVQVFGL